MKEGGEVHSCLCINHVCKANHTLCHILSQWEHIATLAYLKECAKQMNYKASTLNIPPSADIIHVSQMTGWTSTQSTSGLILCSSHGRMQRHHVFPTAVLDAYCVHMMMMGNIVNCI